MNKPALSNLSKFEHDQTFYHLSCIQNLAKSVPTVILGKLLLDQYGVGTAICSIFVGNLIIWLIGLTIVSMVYEVRTNAIDNIKGYLGKPGGLTFALVLVTAFLAWYVNQISNSITALKTIPQFNNLWEAGFDIRFGAVLGLLATILSIGGIKLLKWITTSTFPFLIIYLIYVIFTSKYSATFEGSWGLSIPAVINVILLNLPATINLPTVFRHSRSRVDSFLALSLMAVFITFFECAAIWMDFPASFEFDLNVMTSGALAQVIPFVLFILLTSICANMLNIYLASACYETFIPKFIGNKGYAIMGLLGTATYTFIQISSPVIFSINLVNNYIGITGITLLIAVLSRLVIKHRPRKNEKLLNFISWLVGCSVSTFLEIQHPDLNIHSLAYGIGASVLFFLGVFFVEEMVWSIQKLKSTYSKR